MVEEGLVGEGGVDGNCEGGGGGRVYILLAWLMMRSSVFQESVC